MLGHPFHHIGVACADIDKTAEHIKLAYNVTSDTGTVYDPLQRAFVRLFNEGQPGAIELVAGAAVATLLRHRASYYHICYTTPDLPLTIERALEIGAICIARPKPALLFGGRRVAFVFTPLGLVEFLEER